MKRHYHLVGIGGVGMSALAQALLDTGAVVSGSDRLRDAGDATETLQRLTAQGVRLWPQDGSGVASGQTALVISTAIEADNADLLAARRLNLPVVHRAAQLAEIVSPRRLIAVTGTCGKSTVTAMIGWLLAETGFDPLVVNGAAVIGWEAAGRVGAVRRGAGAWAVIEADESDRSLMVFSPEHAVITNLSADHFQLDETRRLFAAFRARVTGSVVDDQEAAPANIVLEGWQGAFTWEGQRYTVPQPGRHNVVNAWQAVRLARLLGVAPEALAAALARFPGVGRRLERSGHCGDALVVDDYAHNPAKLAAAWQTLAHVFPRVVALWRPHGFTPLRVMLADLEAMFVRTLRPSDRLLLLPVYDAGGTADRTLNSDALVARLRAHGVACDLLPDIATAEPALRAQAAPGTVLAIFGARDPALPRLAERLGRLSRDGVC